MEDQSISIDSDKLSGLVGTGTKLIIIATDGDASLDYSDTGVSIGDGLTQGSNISRGCYNYHQYTNLDGKELWIEIGTSI